MTGFATGQTFGTVLKDVRAGLGLSQAALADQLGSTQRHLSFIETGRSRPTPYFVTRICKELSLSIAQKAALFQAAGLATPFPTRERSSDEVKAALDMIHDRVLVNWPFPALVLDEHWTVLRSNAAFAKLFGPFLQDTNAQPNLLEIMVSDRFRGLIANWDEAATSFFFRLQASSAHSEQVNALFARCRSNGLFDNVELQLSGASGMPVYVPISVNLPNGMQFQITSLLGKLSSVQDALVEGFEIELMLPTDAASEALMRSAFAG